VIDQLSEMKRQSASTPPKGVLKMKKFVITYVISLLFVTSVFAATKCERDYTGGICCWDTNTEGPFKPINC